MIDDKTLDEILFLGRLDVSREEKEKFKDQVGKILDYFDLLKQYDTTGVDPDLGEGLKPSVLREDKSKVTFNESDIETFAVDFKRGFFTVPRIVEDFLENRDEDE
ncbi:MAG: Asp-tRNA(Asn)/Glu-tRNA(Gln) amidotransferase subunit GatC [Spirochaetales bacterium]|nr:Asp-tRNA(Asn)/Glu-tRNA(Gln) amidotransferase subunit GatC [Spirochaetales bacterium]